MSEWNYDNDGIWLDNVFKAIPARCYYMDDYE